LRNTRSISSFSAAGAGDDGDGDDGALPAAEEAGEDEPAPRLPLREKKERTLPMAVALALVIPPFSGDSLSLRAGGD
jgi:hypothetical protein